MSSGQKRRDAGRAGASADFFAAGNADAKAMRDALAMACVDDACAWIAAAPPHVSSVAILDATNTTRARRAAVVARAREALAEAGAAAAADDAADGDARARPARLRVVFLESVCDDARVLDANYDMKLVNDDYKGARDAAAARADFVRRVEAYEAQYEPLSDGELDDDAPPAHAARFARGASVHDGAVVDAFGRHVAPLAAIRVINGGRKLELCRTGASLIAAPIVELLHATHLAPRHVVLASAPALWALSEARGGAPPPAEASSRDAGSSRRLSAVGGSVRVARAVAALVRRTERAAREAAPGGAAAACEVLLDSSRQSVLLAEQVELLLAERAADEVDDAARRTVLTLRALETRLARDNPQQLDRETHADLVRRMRTSILLLERLRHSVVVVCPGEDVRRVLLTHFCGAAVADAPAPAIAELRRDHKGYAMGEIAAEALFDIREEQREEQKEKFEFKTRKTWTND